MKQETRRQFLRDTALAVAGIVAASCSRPANPEPAVTSTTTAGPIAENTPKLVEVTRVVPQTVVVTQTPEPATATQEPTATPVYPETHVPDSVIDGGISDVRILVDVFNGFGRRYDGKEYTQHDLDAMAAARAFAESQYGIVGKIDAGTLEAVNITPAKIQIGAITFSYGSQGWSSMSDDGRYKYMVVEATAPAGTVYRQIAARENGQAYIYNNGRLEEGESVYVVQIIDVSGGGSIVTTVTYRRACGNIGGSEKKATPTPGVPPTPQNTPTAPGETPRPTPRVTKTPGVTETFTPKPPATDTSTPENTSTPVATNTHQATATVGSTPTLPPEPSPTVTRVPPKRLIGWVVDYVKSLFQIR